MDSQSFASSGEDWFVLDQFGHPRNGSPNTFGCVWMARRPRDRSGSLRSFCLRTKLGRLQFSLTLSNAITGWWLSLDATSIVEDARCRT